MYKLGSEEAMKVRDDDTLKGAHSFVFLFEGIFPISHYYFGNTYRDGFFTLGWCTNLAAKQP